MNSEKKSAAPANTKYVLEKFSDRSVPEKIMSVVLALAVIYVVAVPIVRVTIDILAGGVYQELMAMEKRLDLALSEHDTKGALEIALNMNGMFGFRFDMCLLSERLSPSRRNSRSDMVEPLRIRVKEKLIRLCLELAVESLSRGEIDTCEKYLSELEGYLNDYEALGHGKTPLAKICRQTLPSLYKLAELKRAFSATSGKMSPNMLISEYEALPVPTLLDTAGVIIIVSKYRAIAEGYEELFEQTGDRANLENAFQAIDQGDSLLTGSMSRRRGNDPRTWTGTVHPEFEEVFKRLLGKAGSQ
jgi:hypothetical protein